MNEHQRLIEASKLARFRAAVVRYDKLLVVITGHSEGVSKAEIARRIRARFGSCSAQQVWRMEVFLGLETGRGWRTTGKRTGRRDSKAALLEVRP